MNIYCIIDTYRSYSTLCRLLAKEGELVAMLLPALIVTWHAHAAGIKERVRSPVSKNLMFNVLSAVIFPLSNVCNSLHLHIKSRKTNRRLRSLNSPHLKTESLVDLSVVAVLGAVDKQGVVKSPPTVAPLTKKPRKRKLPRLRLLNLLPVVQRWILRLHNWMKNPPTD